MTEINGELYGLSDETRYPTTESDGTTFNCVDNGRLYVAYGGIWYRQPVAWKAQAASSGGSGLPEVSASDNGDVLTVVEGAWAKAAPSGGGGATVVDVEYDDSTNVYISTVKAGALWTAALSGAVIFKNVDDEYGISISSLFGANATDDGFDFSFSFGSNSITLVAATADDYPTSATGEPQ